MVAILGKLKAAAVFALDDCMRPAYGPNGGVIDKCFAAFSSSDNMDEGETFTRRCADGRILYFDPGVSSLQSVTVNLDLNAEPDEAFLAQVGMVEPIMNGAVRIGWTRCTSSTANVLIAIWQEVLGADACEDDLEGGGWRLHLFPVRRARLTLEGAVGAEDGYIRITGSTAATAALGKGPIPLLAGPSGPIYPTTDLNVCHHTVLTNDVAPPPEEDGAIDTVAPA